MVFNSHKSCHDIKLKSTLQIECKCNFFRTNSL